MKPLHKFYTEEVHRELKFYANWVPTSQVSLGDIGVLDGDRYIPRSSLSGLDVQFATSGSSGNSHLSFSSSGLVEISSSTNATLSAEHRAKLEILFKKQGAVFLNLAGCSHSSIQDRTGLEHDLKSLLAADRWNLDWVVVTDVVRSESATIAISNSNSGSLTLEGESGSRQIDLTDASTRLKATSEKGVGYILVAQRDTVPLLGLSRLRKPFFGEPELDERGLVEDIKSSEFSLVKVY